MAQMPSRLSSSAVLALTSLAVFTFWITWKAKALETGPGGVSREMALWNKPAPGFSLPSLDGRTISLADYRGKKSVIVTYWASWCGPCRMELPVLEAFYRHARKAGADFEILAIDIDEYKDSAEGAARELKLPFPVLLDPHQKAAGDYGIYSIPALLIVDKTGKVAYQDIGFNPAMETILAQHLGVDLSVITKGMVDDNSGH
jgi:peroxiredoxin